MNEGKIASMSTLAPVTSLEKRRSPIPGLPALLHRAADEVNQITGGITAAAQAAGKLLLTLLAVCLTWLHYQTGRGHQKLSEREWEGSTVYLLAVAFLLGMAVWVYLRR